MTPTTSSVHSSFRRCSSSTTSMRASQSSPECVHIRSWCWAGRLGRACSCAKYCAADSMSTCTTGTGSASRASSPLCLLQHEQRSLALACAYSCMREIQGGVWHVRFARNYFLKTSGSPEASAKCSRFDPRTKSIGHMWITAGIIWEITSTFSLACRVVPMKGEYLGQMVLLFCIARFTSNNLESLD